MLISVCFEQLLQVAALYRCLSVWPTSSDARHLVYVSQEASCVMGGSIARMDRTKIALQFIALVSCLPISRWGGSIFADLLLRPFMYCYVNDTFFIVLWICSRVTV